MAGKSKTKRAESARRKRVEVRVSPEELRRLDRNAEAASLDRSAYIRAQILREPGDAGKVLGARDWEQIKELYALVGALHDLRSELAHERHDWSKLGTNVNQIARRVNTALASGGPDHSRHVNALLEERRALNSAQRDVREALDSLDALVATTDKVLAMVGEL